MPQFPWLSLPLIGAAAMISALGACDRSGTKPAAPPPATTLAAPDQSYTVRGRIVSLPAPGGHMLTIHHEAIPDFVNRSGRRVGMDEMEMEFEGVAPDVNLAGLQPGDAVEFRFEVRWRSSPSSLVTRVEKLPPDAVLNLKP